MLYLIYASAARNPYKKDVGIVEKVQRSAALFCLRYYERTASVLEMINELKIMRHFGIKKETACLTMLHKLSHGLLDMNILIMY
jgi:hypothetical protein